MDDPDRQLEVFLDVQRGLPRQGPGLDACTLDALSRCVGLPAAPRVLDVGCGPGMQTLTLVEALPGARIIALDMIREFLDQLGERARAAGCAERVDVVQGDMAALPFADGFFDLLWSEGAAYSMGFENALRDWRRLLTPGGSIAVSELVWLDPDPPEEAAAFWAQEYPAIAQVDAVAARFEPLGYELLGHFTLPDEAWWTYYYKPLEAKLPALRERYVDDPDALAIVAATATEIDVRRRFGASYGYEFFVARRRD